MSLDHALAELQRTVPECVACGLVDMKTGLLLAARALDSHPSEALEFVAAATSELYQGQNVAALEQVLTGAPGNVENSCRLFQEIVILSDNHLHLFQRCENFQDLVLVMVALATVDVSMVLSTGRMQLRIVEKLAPFVGVNQ